MIKIDGEIWLWHSFSVAVTKLLHKNKLFANW